SQVRGRVLRYEGDWTGWKGARVTLQRSTRKGWRKVKTVRAGKKDAAAVNAKLPRKAMIRLVTREGKTTFGSPSTGRRGREPRSSQSWSHSQVGPTQSAPSPSTRARRNRSSLTTVTGAPRPTTSRSRSPIAESPLAGACTV